MMPLREPLPEAAAELFTVPVVHLETRQSEAIETILDNAGNGRAATETASVADDGRGFFGKVGPRAEWVRKAWRAAPDDFFDSGNALLNLLSLQRRGEAGQHGMRHRVGARFDEAIPDEFNDFVGGELAVSRPRGFRSDRPRS